MEVRLKPTAKFSGELTPPGDKSISHRAAILNALASGRAAIENFSPGEDCRATLDCLRALGVEVKYPDGGRVEVLGRGRLEEAEDVLDARNSGTTLRLLCGVLAAQPFLSVITGDASLRSRPMDRVISPLRLMGAQIWGRGNDTRAPVVIKGAPLRGITYRLPVPSAQVKSALLLAGLFADGKTVIEEPLPSRDHTERMLKAMGVPLEREGDKIILNPPRAPLRALDLTVPGDISAAAYFMVAAVLHPRGEVRIRNVGLNPTRSGIIEVLRAMGACIRIENERLEGEEPVADIAVGSSSLHGVEIGEELIPRLIDEIPVLAVAALAAPGTTIIRGAGELRVKESDRIATLVRELSLLGARVEELPDGMVIRGGKRLRGGEVASHNDHRLAMALAVASTLTFEEVTISGAEAVAVSYPGFWEEWLRMNRG